MNPQTPHQWLESYVEAGLAGAGPLLPGPNGTEGVYKSGRFKGKTQAYAIEQLRRWGMQLGLKPKVEFDKIQQASAAEKQSAQALPSPQLFPAPGPDGTTKFVPAPAGNQPSPPPAASGTPQAAVNAAVQAVGAATGNPMVQAAGTTASLPAPRPPATFEGQSRDQFFGAAAIRQQQGNQYTGYQVPTSPAVGPQAPTKAAPKSPTPGPAAPLPPPAPAGRQMVAQQTTTAGSSVSKRPSMALPPITLQSTAPPMTDQKRQAQAYISDAMSPKPMGKSPLNITLPDGTAPAPAAAKKDKQRARS